MVSVTDHGGREGETFTATERKTKRTKLGCFAVLHGGRRGRRPEEQTEDGEAEATEEPANGGG